MWVDSGSQDRGKPQGQSKQLQWWFEDKFVLQFQSLTSWIAPKGLLSPAGSCSNWLRCGQEPAVLGCRAVTDVDLMHMECKNKWFTPLDPLGAFPHLLVGLWWFGFCKFWQSQENQVIILNHFKPNKYWLGCPHYRYGPLALAPRSFLKHVLVVGPKVWTWPRPRDACCSSAHIACGANFWPMCRTNRLPRVMIARVSQAQNCKKWWQLLDSTISYCSDISGWWLNHPMKIIVHQQAIPKYVRDHGWKPPARHGIIMRK